MSRVTCRREHLICVLSAIISGADGFAPASVAIGEEQRNHALISAHNGITKLAASPCRRSRCLMNASPAPERSAGSRAMRAIAMEEMLDGERRLAFRAAVVVIGDAPQDMLMIAAGT